MNFHKTKERREKRGRERKRERRQKDKSKEKDDDDDDRVTTATGDDLVILRDLESINLVSDESMWIIDNDATLHMGNDGVTKVISVGDVCLQTNIGMQLWLRGIKHAPDVRFNLISMHMLDDGGYYNHFGYGKWKLTKGNLTKALVAKDSVDAMDMK
ncbi:hypothetical protein CR513_37485, partial [Mucuna pruriens]